MKETKIKKEDILGLLSDINNDLEELDTVIESNVYQFRRDLYEAHSTRMENCGIKMEILEMKVEQAIHTLEETVKKYKNRHTPLKLELGY